MKSKISKVIYYDHQSRPGITFFSVGLNLKTLLLAGLVPGSVAYEGRRRMYHAQFFVSVFTIEVTAIL